MAVRFSEREYQRLGTYPFLRSGEGRRGVFDFFREELEKALKDPNYDYAFGARVAHYARGQLLDEFSHTERRAIALEAKECFVRLYPDLKTLFFVTRSPYTRLHTLRALIVGVPVAFPEPFPFLEGWLTMLHVLYRHENYAAEGEEPLVKLAIRGFYRWATSYIPNRLLKASAWEGFIGGLSLAEKTPYPEVMPLRGEFWKRFREGGDISSLLAAATFTIPKDQKGSPLFSPDSENEAEFGALQQAFEEKEHASKTLVKELELPVGSEEREIFIALVRENLALV